jgi:hypothetical protein
MAVDDLDDVAARGRLQLESGAGGRRRTPEARSGVEMAFLDFVGRRRPNESRLLREGEGRHGGR